MSVIEFQVRTPNFLAAQLTALRSLQICPPRPVPVGPVQIIIDKIEFGNNAIRHNVPVTFSVLYSSLTSTAPGSEVDGLQTQVAQDVAVTITTLNEVMASPNAAPANSITIHGTIVFDLDFYALEEECYIRTAYSSFDIAGLPSFPPQIQVDVNQLLDTVQKTLKAAMPTRSVPAGLNQLTTLWAKFQNAGVSVDNNLQRICFRAQIGGSHPGVAVSWGDFFMGHFDDRVGSGDWAFFVESGLITEFIKAKVNQLLDDAGINQVDNLQTFVGANYSDQGTKAVFTLDVEGVYTLPGNVGNIVRDPKLPMELSVPSPNVIQLRVDYSEIIGLIHSFFIVEFFLPSLSSGLESFMQSMIGSALTDLNKKHDAPYCKKVSDTVVECVKSMQMPAVGTGTTAIMTGLQAFHEGFSLTGTLRSVSLSPVAVNTFVHNFKWQPPKISCGAASMALVALFMDSASGFKILHGQGIVDNQGSTPLYLCSWSVINDRLSVFPQSAITVDAGPAGIIFSVDLPIPDPKYYHPASPGQPANYPCQLLVKTTGGTRLLQIPPPPEVTQADLDRLAAELLVKVGNCEQLVDPWFKHHAGYNPEWSVDPPVNERVEHLWQVEVAGLEAGERVSLVDAHRNVVVSAVAREGAVLSLSAVVAPAARNELTVLRGELHQAMEAPAGTRSESTMRRGSVSNIPDRGIQVVQHQLEQIGSVSLNEACMSVVLSPVLVQRGVMAVTHNGIRLYGFSRTFFPVLAGSWNIAGIRGAVSWHGAVLFFGESGAGWIDPNGKRIQATNSCTGNRWLDVATAGSTLFSLSATSLDSYNPQLCKTGSIDFHGGRCIIRCGAKLIVGTTRGLQVFSSGRLESHQRFASEGSEVVALTRALGYEKDTFLATFREGYSKLLRVSDNDITELAHFSETPWFADSMRLGETLVRISGDKHSLDISRFGKNNVI